MPALLPPGKSELAKTPRMPVFTRPQGLRDQDGATPLQTQQRLASTYGPMPHDPVFLVFWLVSFLPLDDGIKYAFLQMRSQYQRMQTLDAVLRLGERFAEPGSRGAGGTQARRHAGTYGFVMGVSGVALERR